MTFFRRFPTARPRRMRRDECSRRLMREHHRTTDDLIYPMFVLPGQGRGDAVVSMCAYRRIRLSAALRDGPVGVGRR